MKKIVVALAVAGLAVAITPGTALAAASGPYSKANCHTAEASARHSGYTITRSCRPFPKGWFFFYDG